MHRNRRPRMGYIPHTSHPTPMCVNVSGSTRRTESRNRSKVRGAPPPSPAARVLGSGFGFGLDGGLFHIRGGRGWMRGVPRGVSRGGRLRGGVPAGSPNEFGEEKTRLRGRLFSRVRPAASRTLATRSGAGSHATPLAPAAHRVTARQHHGIVENVRSRPELGLGPGPPGCGPGVSSAVVEGAREESEVRPARGCRGGEGVDEGGADEGIGGGWVVLRGWRRRGSGGGSGEDERRGKFGGEVVHFLFLVEVLAEALGVLSGEGPAEVSVERLAHGREVTVRSATHGTVGRAEGVHRAVGVPEAQRVPARQNAGFAEHPKAHGAVELFHVGGRRRGGRRGGHGAGARRQSPRDDDVSV